MTTRQPGTLRPEVGDDDHVLGPDDAPVTLAEYKESFMTGVRSGVNGTPTFFVNGTRFDGDWTSADAFTAALERAAT